jgi:hypothetical protein
MEYPTEVHVYFEQMTGDAKRARLLAISPNGYYELNLQTASGVRRALVPIARTILVAAEVEPSATVDAPEVER